MKQFVRTIEDFTCDRCGTRVTGSGYTNHCPSCLWSKHVDVHPGDRSSLCKGLMSPESVRVSSGSVRIVHRCEVCGFIRMQDADKKDNPELLITLSAQPFSEGR